MEQTEVYAWLKIHFCKLLWALPPFCHQLTVIQNQSERSFCFSCTTTCCIHLSVMTFAPPVSDIRKCGWGGHKQHWPPDNMAPLHHQQLSVHFAWVSFLITQTTHTGGKVRLLPWKQQSGGLNSEQLGSHPTCVRWGCRCHHRFHSVHRGNISNHTWGQFTFCYNATHLMPVFKPDTTRFPSGCTHRGLNKKKGGKKPKQNNNQKKKKKGGTSTAESEPIYCHLV